MHDVFSKLDDAEQAVSIKRSALDAALLGIRSGTMTY